MQAVPYSCCYLIVKVCKSILSILISLSETICDDNN